MLIIDEIRNLLRVLVQVIKSAIHQIADGLRRLVASLTEVMWLVLLLLSPAVISFGIYWFRRDAVDLVIGLAYLALLAVLTLLNRWLKPDVRDASGHRTTGEQMVVVVALLLVVGFVVFRSLHFAIWLADTGFSVTKRSDDHIRDLIAERGRKFCGGLSPERWPIVETVSSGECGITRDEFQIWQAGVSSRAAAGISDAAKKGFEATKGALKSVPKPTVGTTAGKGCENVIVEPVTDGGQVIIHFPLSCGEKWKHTLPEGEWECLAEDKDVSLTGSRPDLPFEPLGR